jgi:type III restriction enzyme
MSTRGDKRTFRNEDLILKVTENIDPKKWDEGKYEAFLDELCGFREYQKEAIRVTLRFFGAKHANLRALAKENLTTTQSCRTLRLVGRDGEAASIARSIGLLVDQGRNRKLRLRACADLLAEGAVERVLVLCPSNTIEDGR